MKKIALLLAVVMMLSFAPSSQILFEDNFPYAYTAEDLAVTGDISITTLKNL